MKDSALRLLWIIAILLTSTIQKCNSKYIDFSKLKETIVNEPDFNTFITPYIENSSDIRLFTRKNVEDLFTAISTQFPEISRLSNIGKSIENRDMIMLTLGSKLQKNEGKEKAINPPSIFITSAHHAREILSVTMNVYIVLSAVHGYFHPPALEQSNMWQKGSPISWYHNSAVYKTLLSNHNLYILPFVNIDGYEIVSNVYEEKGIFEIVRKNRRIDGNWFGVSIGVDLNRNYGFKWGLDNIGSSPRKCDEDYRGSGPFSEPETQAIRDFIQSNDKNIKIAINLHTWGNLFIIPFNYDDIKNKHMVGTPIYKMYQDIKENGNLPKGMLFGNGMQTIEYTTKNK